jgi:hypothetical protein
MLQALEPYLGLLGGALGPIHLICLQLCPTSGFLHSSHQAHLTNPPSMHCCSMSQVLSKAPATKESGKAFLEELTPLVVRFPHNQALMCLQARQLMQLGRYEDALLAVAPALGCGNDLAPSRWAIHLTVHAHWLTGGLDQVCPHF